MIRLLALVFFASSIAYAGGESNGGGGFICRSKLRSIKKLISYDRWFGTRDLKYTIPSSQKPAEEQARAKIAEIDVLNSVLADFVSMALENVIARLNEELAAKEDDAPGQNRDYTPARQPNEYWCPDDTKLEYRTFINYEDGRIGQPWLRIRNTRGQYHGPNANFLRAFTEENLPLDEVIADKQVFSTLTSEGRVTKSRVYLKTDHAMILMHEAVYKVFRFLFEDTNADRAIEFVALLFSNLSLDQRVRVVTEIQSGSKLEEPIFGVGMRRFGFEYSDLSWWKMRFLTRAKTDFERKEALDRKLFHLGQEFEKGTNDRFWVQTVQSGPRFEYSYFHTFLTKAIDRWEFELALFLARQESVSLRKTHIVKLNDRKEPHKEYTPRELLLEKDVELMNPELLRLREELLRILP